MRKFSTEWLVTIAAITLVGFAILVIFFQNEIYWERKAKEEYREIKASMEVHYEENADEFPRIWRFSKGLPAGISIHFSEDDEVDIKRYQEIDNSLIEKAYISEIEYYRNIDFDDLIIPLPPKKNDTIILDSNQEIKWSFTLIRDSTFTIEEEKFLYFSGKMYEIGYADSLAKMNLRPQQIDSLKILLNQANLYEGFKKDREGNIYLNYWSFPNVGAFTFVMPKRRFTLNANVYEAGLLDRDLGLYWQFQDLDGLICFAHPVLIRN